MAPGSKLHTMTVKFRKQITAKFNYGNCNTALKGLLRTVFLYSEQPSVQSNDFVVVRFVKISGVQEDDTYSTYDRITHCIAALIYVLRISVVNVISEKSADKHSSVDENGIEQFIQFSDRQTVLRIRGHSIQLSIPSSQEHD